MEESNSSGYHEAFIKATLARILPEIEGLFAEKARLSRKLNTLCARTAILPTEILAAIFDLACSSPQERSQTSCVCSHWRHIVYTTPSLWIVVPPPYSHSNSLVDTVESLDERYIKATLSRVSAEAEGLCLEKARLSRKLNTLCARTAHLPTSILTAIFEPVCSGYHQRSQIGSVCSHWRRIVNTTPSLWRAVSLPYSHSNGTELLRLHRQNAGDVLLLVKLYTREYAEQETKRPLLQFLFTDLSHNIRSLTFNNIDSFVWSLILACANTTSGLSKLEDLTLSFSRTKKYSLKGRGTLFGGSRLTRLRLVFGMPGLEDRLPLKDIRFCSGKSLSSQHGIRILALCPKVVEFDWVINRRSQWFEEVFATIPEPPPTPVILPFLETLTWRGGDLFHAANLVRRIQLPSVQKLEWEEPSPLASSDDQDDFRKPFFSSMSQVRTLKCWLNEETREMVPHLPSLEVVEIFCRGPVIFFVADLARRLTWTGHDCLLPKLISLTFDIETSAPSELDAIVQMLQYRRARWFTQCVRLKTFTLRIKLHDITEVWQQVHIDSFKYLVQGGLDLILETGNSVSQGMAVL